MGAKRAFSFQGSRKILKLLRVLTKDVRFILKDMSTGNNYYNMYLPSLLAVENINATVKEDTSLPCCLLNDNFWCTGSFSIRTFC